MPIQLESERERERQRGEIGTLCHLTRPHFKWWFQHNKRHYLGPWEVRSSSIWLLSFLVWDVLRTHMTIVVEGNQALDALNMTFRMYQIEAIDVSILILRTKDKKGFEFMTKYHVQTWVFIFWIHLPGFDPNIFWESLKILDKSWQKKHGSLNYLCVLW